MLPGQGWNPLEQTLVKFKGSFLRHRLQGLRVSFRFLQNVFGCVAFNEQEAAQIDITQQRANEIRTMVRDALFDADVCANLVGDEATAKVCQRVHDEEIGHVRSASIWLCHLGGPGIRDLDAYRDAVPFPLSLARAKSRRFFAPARRRAGLSEAFIEAVRWARSSQETGLAPVRPKAGA